jgi:hypothetical protein
MKDDADRPRSEMDVLKFYIWLMLVMTVALAVFFWIVSSDLDDTRKNLQQGQTWTKEFADEASEIQAMLNVHATNKEDAARDNPLSWFANVWRSRGINDQSIVPQAWAVPPRSDTKGSMRYYEENIDVQFNSRAPLTRQQIAEFCHEVEKRSTRLRILELDVRRVDRDTFDKDAWTGKAKIGYRHAKLD